MWLEKYKPKKFEEIVGNDTAVRKLINYSWKKPLLLYGPTGIGKTTLVELLSEKFDLIWASDENLDKLKEISNTKSLFGKKKLIIFDNVDMISEIKKVTEFLKETKVPTILITSDFKSRRLGTIKRICEKLQMRKPQLTTIVNLLQKICTKENIKVKSKEVLLKIAENSNGDIRAAILDLETVSKGKEQISENDIEVLVSRDKVGDIYKSLSVILLKNNIREAIESTYDLNEQPRDVLFWIDENSPKVIHDKKNLKKAFYYLSRADIFLGRILKRQYWGFLRYANSLMTAGVNVSKGKKIHFVRYQFPFYIIHMSQTKKERNLKKSIAEKLSREIHDSQKTIINEFIPLFKILLKEKKINRDEFAEHFRFTNEELEIFS